MSIRWSAVLFSALWLLIGLLLVSVLFIARMSLLESALNFPRDSYEVRALTVSLQLTMWLSFAFALVQFALPHIVKYSMNGYLNGLHMGATLLFLLYISSDAIRPAWFHAIHRTDHSCFSYDGGTTPTGYFVLGLAVIAQIGLVANILLTVRRARRFALNQ